MIRWLISGLVIGIIFTALISVYLQPNDLGDCGATPTVNVGCQKVDAIVAVSGGDTAARTSHAVNLYKNGWSDVLILSGAAQDKTGPSNAAVMKQLAIDAGVPDSAIYIDEYSETTKQNAENVKSIFEELNIKKVILATSGYHQRRASLEFNKRANDVTILNSPVVTDKDWSMWWWLTPRGWWLAVSETVKIGVFYTVGAIGYE